MYSEGQKGAAKRAESPEVRLVLHWIPEQEGLVANRNKCKRERARMGVLERVVEAGVVGIIICS